MQMSASEPPQTGPASGMLAWFARNPVAANLLALFLLIGGVLVGTNVKQEVFPDFELDVISVVVPYPGASPSEVEQGIVLAVEEAARGVDGVDRVTAVAAENSAGVYVHLDNGVDAQLVLSDVKNAVDRLTSLPKEAERPVVSLVTNKLDVISVILHGAADEGTLRAVAEQVREELLTGSGVTTVELVGAPPREIAIEVPRVELRSYGLTLDGIARTVAATAVEVPGGSVKTPGGEVLLRTTERRHSAREFEQIPLLSSPSGTELPLGAIAKVTDTFSDTGEAATFNGEPAIMLRVFRAGDETPIDIADRVKAHVERLRQGLPEGLSLTIWTDWSEIYQQRIDLLVRNATLGLCLVMLILSALLEIRLAFWVTMGIPISFLGALLLMPAFDVSVNMISLFAFIVVLGMVVDDAIVVGENIFELRQQGASRLDAAIAGVKGVATPVVFAVATTMAAFAPMLFVPGVSGKMYRVIPTIVISVLAISLVESLLVLPAHLASLKPPAQTGLYAGLHRQQQRISRGLQFLIDRLYRPTLAASLRNRYITVASAAALLIATFGFIGGGHIGFRYFPNIAGDLAIASVAMPYGTPVEATKRVQEHILHAAQEVLAENGEPDIVYGILAQVGTPLPGDPGDPSAALGGSHLANVQVYFVDAGERRLQSETFMQKWRERVGRIAGADQVKFAATTGPSPGAPINVELLHPDMEVLRQASAALAQALTEYRGVWDVDDGYTLGKPQLDMKLTPLATNLGLSVADVATQVRSAFYGSEALRQQEGRNEVKVMVRLPQAERESTQDVASLLIRTPSGGELPLNEVVEITPGRSYPFIERSDAHRYVSVTADVVPGSVSPDTVLTDLETTILPKLVADYPGLTYQYGGSQREQQQSMGTLLIGAQLALLAMFGMLAIVFRSYIQPVIVMTAIPFGIIGALIGHLLLGFEFSMISVMGLIALAGVVVNDCIVLIDAANEFRRQGMSAYEAVHAAGARRFRPILLTSSTTFFGLTPMIFETSIQARFLVPMAVSLGFGVAFATAISLVLIPSVYLCVEDVKHVLGGSGDI